MKQLFQQYPWHGNLRELKNVVKRAALLTEGDIIKAQSVPIEISHHTRLSFDDSPVVRNLVEEEHSASSEVPNLKSAAREAEYETIIKVLKQVNFNKSKAAKF